MCRVSWSLAGADMETKFSRFGMMKKQVGSRKKLSRGLEDEFRISDEDLRLDCGSWRAVEAVVSKVKEKRLVSWNVNFKEKKLVRLVERLVYCPIIDSLIAWSPVPEDSNILSVMRNIGALWILVLLSVGKTFVFLKWGRRTNVMKMSSFAKQTDLAPSQNWGERVWTSLEGYISGQDYWSGHSRLNSGQRKLSGSCNVVYQVFDYVSMCGLVCWCRCVIWCGFYPSWVVSAIVYWWFGLIWRCCHNIYGG